jgi:Photosynthetic reaction centre cytochrome C subunit
MKLRIPLLALLLPLLAVEMMYSQQEKASVSADEPSTPEAIRQFNDDRVAELSKQIAGKEDQPAEAVFKNIRILTGVPAENLLKIMQMGYSRSLGTSCAHCHVPGQWEKDDKKTKQIARDMSKMSHTIIFDLLRNIDGIKDRDPLVNCTTCHRGQLKPALNLDSDGTEEVS